MLRPPALRLLALLGPALLLSALPSRAQDSKKPLSAVDAYNYVVGTQTIGAAYQFTQEPRLVETARAIRDMGSNTIKFSLAADKNASPKPQSLTDIAQSDPAVKTVLHMPFVNYILWAYPLSTEGNRFKAASLGNERQEMYDLTRHLLQTYDGTGKTFYLGNWEGDWHLTHLNPNYSPTPTEVQNFVAWINAHQQAVDDARRDTPHKNVQVYCYLEVNRVVDAMQGKTRLSNAVLPKTNVDFVSYSSYDSLGGDIGANLTKALNYIESQMPPKPGLTGKRVWIGEYGFPADANSPRQQDDRTRQVIRAGLAWGCPFVLYWELYNNEVTPDGKQRGFWLIDDHNVKQPAYFTHQRFYAQARRYVAAFQKDHHRLPTRAEFGQTATAWLDTPTAPAPKTSIHPGAANHFRRRYVLFFANMNRDADRDKLDAVMMRAAAIGYNGIVLGDFGGQYIHLATQPPAFFNNFAHIRTRAKALGLALIPYSFNPTQVTYADPTLAEAVPVRGTEFIVQGQTAVPAPTPQLLVNSGFEEHTGNQPAGWAVDKPGVVSFVDSNVKRSGMASLRIQDPSTNNPPYGHARHYQKVAVTPFRAYDLSVWMKTDHFTKPGTISLYVAGNDGQQPELYSNRDANMEERVAPTQDWKEYHALFNSLTNTSIEVYVGAWADKDATGKLWFDDMALQEVGLVGAVRRPSLPIIVTSADGSRTYQEKTDYTVGDGRLPLPPSSAIPEGARLKVSWYQGATMVQDTPPASAWQDGYWTIEEDISRRLDALFGHPSAFMMTYDEWRAANWDPAGAGTTAGQYVAQTTRKSIAMLHRINPNYEVSVWSDMYDPNENAQDKYYVVNGSLNGSWKGLTPGTVVMTWTGDAKALKFFSDQGLSQVIGGYYDSVGNVRDWLDALDKVEAQGARGINGFLYTTWDGRYDDLEEVAAAIKTRGRWGAGPALPGSKRRLKEHP